jgi:Protein of unknown function (DUF1566)
MTAVKAKSSEVPTDAGAPFAGGIYAGRFFIDALQYALIVSPADTGELPATPRGNGKKIAGAKSYNDGPTNTQAMAKAGSGLGKWARELRIDGHDDWYIPSRLELLVAFGELDGLKVFGRAWYWSSTQYASDDDYAWCQNFTSGYQSLNHEDNELRARAVRRLVIE